MCLFLFLALSLPSKFSCGLFTGKRSRVIAMPTLEITADNVVCSHGASVADIDENSMFYLSARGIKQTEVS